MTANDRAGVARQISLAMLVAWWAALFVATHLPRVPAELLKHSDKRLHFATFAVLAALFAWTWSSRAKFGVRQCLAILAILAVYGAIDEITQPLVGRTMQSADWVADMLGVLCGLIACTVCLWLARRKREVTR